MQQPQRNLVKAVSNATTWLNLIWLAEIPSNAKLVACNLRKYMNSETDMAFPGIRRIASECGLTQTTVIKWINHLEEQGWLATRRGNRKESTKYWIAFPEGVLQQLEQGALMVDTKVLQPLEHNKQGNKQINNKGEIISTRSRSLSDDINDTSWAK